MTGDRPHVALLLAAALTWVPAAAAPAVESALPSPRIEWRTLQTDNFRLVGDVSPRRMKEMGEALELFRSSLLRLKPQASSRAPVPTLVLAFAGRRSFVPYATIGLEPGREVAGIFRRTRWGNYMVVDASAGGEDPLAVVHHEYVHDFVAANYPSTPLWLNEGLAEYFSTFRVTREGLQVGRPVRWHVLELRKGWRLPLGRLLEVDHSDPEYREGDKVGPFYAQSWLLVHYALVGEPGMAPRLVDLLGRLDHGEPVATAFPAAFGIGIEELESRLLRYVRQPAFRYLPIPVPDLDRPAIGEPAELARAEALRLLGEYLAHVGAVGAAREHLAAAAGLDPGDGDALALLAYLEQVEERPERARELYARVSGPALRRAASALHAARFELEAATPPELDEAGGRARLERARALAERSLELDPDFGEAWLVRGQIEMRGGDPTAALVSFAEAQRRLPDRVDVVYGRFQASLAAGQTVAARGIAAGPLRRLDPELAAEAAKQLEWRATREIVDAALEESERRRAAGDLETADDPLREALARIRDPEQRRFLEERITWVEDYAARQARIDRYNRGVELTNAGRFREAAAALEELLEDCADEEVCDAARDLREQLARFLARR